MDFLSIEQIKSLSISDASDYCEKLRKYIIATVSRSGGHLASNLGVAEISLALIRLFDSPKDKIIYDVGHQSYVHKLLTGRIFDYSNLRKFNGFSGFTKTEESEHDPFGAGHSSTSISAALGYAKAARIKGEDSYSIAVIGDGAFCNGMTFEALNNISKNDKIIIILNDNEMSISQNVGSMAHYLNKIRVTNGYIKFKSKTKLAFNKIPLLGGFLTSFASVVKNFFKRILIKNTFFEDLGLDYIGPADGNDLYTVERILEKAKLSNGPILVHFVTKKGKGYSEAEEAPNEFHFVAPASNNKSNNKTFSNMFSELITEYSLIDKKAVAITAAMGEGTGLTIFKERIADRFFDVGICEEHAATFSAGLSSAGLLPFYVVYSTFFQRCYDQVLHDVALQKLKMIIALDRSGLVGEDGATHHGVFDVSLTLNLPNTAIYSPATYKDLNYAFEKCVNYEHLSILRYPKDYESKITSTVFSSSQDFQIDSTKKCNILFVTYGRVTEEVIKAKILLEKKGKSVVILKFLKLKPLDYAKINKLICSLSPDYIIGIEEGMKIGGFCEFLFSNISFSAIKHIIAIDDVFVPQGNISQLFDLVGLSAPKIYEKTVKLLYE